MKRPGVNGTLLAVLILVAVVSVADIAAATLIRIYTQEIPAVAGDVSKVGIGVLGGAAAAIYGNNGNGNPPKGG